MSRIPKVAGDLAAYEFHVWASLNFLCSDCGTRLDCPVLDSDVEAPNPPWSIREAKRAMSLGWYVHSACPLCFCPSCAKKRDLQVPSSDYAAA